MKKQYRLIPTILLFSILFVGCKKDSVSDSNKPKDYSALVVDKTWWGTFAYKDSLDEYYSMHFNADNTLDWDQQLGQYTGYWHLDSNRITITFKGNDTKITAKIGNDSTLSQISDNTDFSELKSGQMVGNPKIPLDNTTWQGSMKIMTVYIPMTLAFNDKSQVLKTFGGLKYALSNYSRSSSGGALWATIEGSDTFLVIVSEDEMYGILSTSIHFTKQ